MSDVTPGWYPANEGRELRYWDGQAWTGDVQHQTVVKDPTDWRKALGFGLLLLAAILGWVGFDLLLSAF